MSASKTLVSVEEYLHTVYQPDCDYVDGEVLERNMAERDHAWMHTAFGSSFFVRREWGITLLTEMRVQVSPTRYRISDICIILGKTNEQILTNPPFLCIEILSPEDRWSGVEARMNDFISMGVRFIWVLDPQTKQAYIVTGAAGLREVKDGILRTQEPVFEIPLTELFS